VLIQLKKIEKRSDFIVLNNGIVDETDKIILELLQEDAKITIREIAEKTEKSATAIRARIQRLENS